jgi:protease-4
MMFLLLVLSLGMNLLFLVGARGCSGGNSSGLTLEERHHSGKTDSYNKVAVIRMEGAIMEGLLGYVNKQIEKAAEDEHVKAVVLRINSPGGTITASDDLHRRLTDLRQGKPDKHRAAKPLVVSMASLAASGGYYIAMPASPLFAERTTVTGSIGVYAAFPNIAGLANKYGISMEVIKAGAIKDSGSMFHHMTPQERQVWQDMVDHAYQEFVNVVERGRPTLKGNMTTPILERMIPDRDENGKVVKEDGKVKMVPFTRQRADGGIFTADQALELGLIDKIGYLDDAINEARQQAGLGEDFQAIQYERPWSLLGGLLGADATMPENHWNPRRLASAATPRLWYLSPQSELTGFLSAAGVGEP